MFNAKALLKKYLKFTLFLIMGASLTVNDDFAELFYKYENWLIVLVVIVLLFIWYQRHQTNKQLGYFALMLLPKRVAN